MSDMNVNSAAGVSFSQMQGMDIESMLMAVQGNRANLLEQQLMGEMKNVQAKNEQIAVLNGKLTALTGASQLAYADNKTTPEATLTEAQKTALAAASPKVPTWEVTLVDGTKIQVDEAGKNEADDCKAKNWAFRSSDYSGSKGVTSIVDKGLKADPTAAVPTFANKGELDKAITGLKGQVDSLGSNQQMDMLRLQSLSNKRNEAFDLMTNFMKKFADKREAIISNMR